MELDKVEGDSHAMDWDGLDSVMDILMDMSSHLKATEHGVEVLLPDRTTAKTRGSQSTSTPQQGGWTVRACARSQPLQQLQLSDLSEAIRRR